MKLLHILSYGSASEDVLLRELATEARRYLELLQMLPEGDRKKSPWDDERDVKETSFTAPSRTLLGRAQSPAPKAPRQAR